MERFIRRLKRRARRIQKKIVFPESDDERILKAVRIIVDEELAQPVLIGTKEIIKKKAKELRISLKGIRIVELNPDIYAQKLYELRKAKGLTFSNAKQVLKNPIYFATMMLHENEVDGLIAGATVPTSETLKPAFQIIKTKTKFHKASGAFFMMKKSNIFIFADSAVNILPTAHELAWIAIDSATTARKFGLRPKIAMLSFST